MIIKDSVIVISWMYGYCECNYICDAYIQTNINLSEHKYCVMAIHIFCNY